MINIDTRLFDLITDESQMWLLMHIAKRINKNRACFPKNSTLAQDCKWGENKLQKVKKQLKDLGILKVEARKIEGRQRANNYIVSTNLIGIYVSLDKIKGTPNEGTPIKGNLNEGGLNEGTLKQGNISITHNQVLNNPKVLNNISSINVDKPTLPSSKKEIKPKIKKEVAATSKAETLTKQLDNVFKFKVIMQYLIEKTGKAFKIGDTEAKIKRSDKFKKINARLVDGYAVEDFKAVIDTKCRDGWKESENEQVFAALQASFLAY